MNSFRHDYEDSKKYYKGVYGCEGGLSVKVAFAQCLCHTSVVAIAEGILAPETFRMNKRS